MTFTNSDNETQEMSTPAATSLVRQMVELETKGSGDVENAMRRISRHYPKASKKKLGFWQLSHLRGGRARECSTTLYQRVRQAYLDYCEDLIARLEHDIELERQRGHADETLEDIGAKAAAIALEIRKAKQGREPAP